MINLFHKKSKRNQRGAATLLITTLLIVSVTMISIFSANYSLLQQKISAGGTRNLQAYDAAEAGLEFGINYLRQNSSTILANVSGGYLQPYSDSNTNNVTLANGSKYTITYSNPVANNYELLLVSSTGSNNDNTATRVVNQLIGYGSILSTTPSTSVATKGSVSLTGSAQIVNTESNATIQAGSSVSISGSAQTIINSGVGSDSSSMGSDVQQNVSSISSMSNENYFKSYFGVSMDTVKSNANYTYTNLGNYSSVLNGRTGALIWIDQSSGDASINGSVSIGSATNPVILIINGNFDMSGSATIYGVVFVMGSTTTDITGSPKIHGALISTDNLNIKGSANITFNSSILNEVQQNIGYYAKIPGSWKDY